MLALAKSCRFMKVYFGRYGWWLRFLTLIPLDLRWFSNLSADLRLFGNSYGSAVCVDEDLLWCKSSRWKLVKTYKPWCGFTEEEGYRNCVKMPIFSSSLPVSSIFYISSSLLKMETFTLWTVTLHWSLQHVLVLINLYWLQH